MNEKYFSSECNKLFLRAKVLKDEENIVNSMTVDTLYNEVYCENEYGQEFLEKYGFRFPYITILVYKYGVDYMLKLVEKSGHSEAVIEDIKYAIRIADKEIKELKDFAKELYKMVNEVNC